MPCFKGIAVSVHADGAPLPEYSVQKQSRVSRVNTYIPVPPPKISKDALNKPEPSKFAISITLLTPGLAVPYSTPKASASEPHPKPKIVADLPSAGSDRPPAAGAIGPYTPLTRSENETIAAYIYFDGRAKEEVATLLRPGEETWVNSRWVQVAASEGGGLAEREFLFREVGLERWLNGLDLDGQDAAAKIQRRRQKFEKRRRRREAEGGLADGPRSGPRDVLRYGADERSPVEQISEDEDLSSDSDDDAPPEAAGQIKVAMFRVLASGEIKKGEYSPQFDAHDDDDDSSESGMKGGTNGAVEDVDHTTSFAKPKTLDPSTISTQTVTGIDGPDKPYATFTFFYRGERQLQKMGIMESSKPKAVNGGATKRRSTQMDFASLPPLKQGGTVGFSAFRDGDKNAPRKSKSRKDRNGTSGNAMDEDSEDDDEDEDMSKMDDDEKDIKANLSPEDARHQGELADGVGRIKLKRQHSAEPESAAARQSPASNTSAVQTPSDNEPTAPPPAPNTAAGILSKSIPDESVVGSPLKKHRASIYDDEEKQRRMGSNFPPGLGDVLAAAEAAQSASASASASQSPEKPAPSVEVELKQAEEEEEL